MFLWWGPGEKKQDRACAGAWGQGTSWMWVVCPHQTVMAACTGNGFSYPALQEGVLELLSPRRWRSSRIMVKVRLERTGMSILAGKKTILWKEVQKYPPLVAPSWQLQACKCTGWSLAWSQRASVNSPVLQKDAKSWPFIAVLFSGS